MTIFTFSEGIMVSYSVVVADPKNVFIALFLTCLITVALTFYAFYTKTDFTIYGGVLFMAGLVLLGIGILFLIFGGGKLGYIILCSLFVILFGVYLIYDT